MAYESCFEIIDLQPLKKWFLQEKRDLPWRATSDPYAVWISEIMLQQTKVSVVIPYYLNWMRLFPTVSTLAQADLNDVIKAWEGLGYYSRARNLHTAAQQIEVNHGGKIPNNAELLSKIKGIGPYTLGAILSFAFHQKKAAVDGNVMRVISRLYQIDEDITKATTQIKMRSLVEKILPDQESWIINEALIELGATICQRNPKCSTCPLSNQCHAYLRGDPQSFPIKSKAPAITTLYRSALVFRQNFHYLVKKGKKGHVMADLYEFPFLEHALEKISEEFIAERCLQDYQLQIQSIQPLSLVKHGFTRYQVFLQPYLLNLDSDQIIAENFSNFEFLPLDKLLGLPFSAGHKRILNHLLVTQGHKIT